MNIRTVKEMRALGPAFVLVMLAAALPVMFGPSRREVMEVFMSGLFGLGCLIMGAEIFGNEFHQKTLPLLLAQPVARARIWREKMFLLGAALAVGSGLFLLALVFFREQLIRNEDFPWAGFVMIPVSVFCTVPFWTLLTRSSFAGGLMSLVAPGMLLAVNSFLHDRFLEHGGWLLRIWFEGTGRLNQHWVKETVSEEGSVITLLVVSSALCCWLAYRRFQRLQVVDGYSMTASKELKLPSWVEAVVSRPFRFVSAPFTGPVAAMMKKEMRLQQPAFVAAAIFSIAVIIGFVGSEWRTTPSGAPRDWGEVLTVCAFTLYLPLLPLIAGAVAVAEEKAWGVADWHRTLPPSVETQWVIKRWVALATAAGLGLILPAVLLIMDALFSGHHENAGTQFVRSFGEGSLEGALMMLGLIILAQALVTTIAIYAGTIARTSARALALALGIIITGGAVVKGAATLAMSQRFYLMQIRGEFFIEPSYESLPYSQGISCLFAFVILCCIQLFAYHRFRARGQGRSQLIWQLAILAALVFISGLAIVTIHLT